MNAIIQFPTTSRQTELGLHNARLIVGNPIDYTDANLRDAAEVLEACGSGDDYRLADKAILEIRLRKHIANRRAEIAAGRAQTRRLLAIVALCFMSLALGATVERAWTEANAIAVEVE